MLEANAYDKHTENTVASLMFTNFYNNNYISLRLEIRKILLSITFSDMILH